MEATRRGRPIGAGRINVDRVDAATADDTRRHLAEDGFNPDAPLAGFVARPPLAALRARLGLSQQGLADKTCIPVKTIRNWEQGRSEPDPAARALLTIIAHDPDGAFEAIRVEGERVASGGGVWLCDMRAVYAPPEDVTAGTRPKVKAEG